MIGLDVVLKSSQVCPFLGLRHDSGTAYYNPSPANHCYQATPVTPVKLDYQRRFCLSENHIACMLFYTKMGQSKKRYKEITLRPVGGWTVFKKRLLGLGAFVIVAAVMVRMAFLLPFTTVPPAETKEYLVSTIVEHTKVPVLSTIVPTPANLTLSETPTILVAHGLEIPFGEHPSLLIHQVKDGESLPFLALHYNTSENAIISVNYHLSLPLLNTTVLVIPLNQENVNNLPQFEPYFVSKRISLSELVEQFSVDMESVMYYNLYHRQYALSPGEWVLISSPKSRHTH